MSDLIKDLAKILDESNMQITFTGWKAELEKAEARIKGLEAERAALREALEKMPCQCFDSGMMSKTVVCARCAALEGEKE